MASSTPTPPTGATAAPKGAKPEAGGAGGADGAAAAATPRKRASTTKSPATSVPRAAAKTATKIATAVLEARPAVFGVSEEPGHSVALVPVPKPQPDPELPDPRKSDVDEWGRSEHMRELARRLYAPLYDTWHRVEWEGLEKIPTTGGALLVSNHAGAIPADAPSIMHGIETELGRPVYGLADEVFKRMPVIGTLWSRSGGVLAHPDNAYRLLREQQQLALVFPEGTKGTGKTYGDRYQLRRFGRGGYVQIAMRAGVPIVPIAVVGSEESQPILFKSPQLAKLFGVPYVPITANMLAFAALGPLGMLLDLPSKIRIKVLDPVHFDVEPDQPRYSRSRIMDESEAIRQRIQEALFEMLRTRASVWFG